MHTRLKSVVLKTDHLQKTMDFFTSQIGIVVSEHSESHFVLHGSDIRVLFMVETAEPLVELYFDTCEKIPCGNEYFLNNKKFIVQNDPNSIRVIIAK